MPELESDPDDAAAADATKKDTLYPVSPVGDPYAVPPKPLSSELQARLKEIGEQDVAR